MKPEIGIKIGQAILISILLAQTGSSQTVAWHGQLSGWVIGNSKKSLISQAGFRYIPDILIEKTLAENIFADAAFSLNTFGAISFRSLDNSESDSETKTYRAWVRLATGRFEARLGLQKINFGSATLFRPLRWFDRIDPRDPLQLTEGVYGLLLRYYFLNNANIWLWGLYGNDQTKGWEIAPTKEESFEFGGRAQAPLFTGEIGLTYHHRQADFSRVVLPLPVFPREDFVSENRFGLDGKWDIGIGVWLEGALSHRKTALPDLKYQRFWTIGIDYTFGFGNGVNAVLEYFNTVSADRALGSGEGVSFSALSINYPLGLVDNLSAIIFYDWQNYEWYRTAILRRLYDNWSIYLIGFWNPAAVLLSQNQAGDNPFVGKGLQLMVVFNH